MLNQPISQVRLTNVALIKYKLHNRKFEIACYKNKAINWRNGIEKDLDEVLQSNNIFTNASQGQLAGKDELKKYFPGLDRKEILKIILDNGELQISDKERDSNFTNIFNDVANIITEKCVHSLSKRPISIDSVKQAIRDIHFPIKLDQPAKRQALFCMKQLMRKFLMARAEMKIEITCKLENKDKLLKELEKIGISKPNEIKEKGESLNLTLLIEPAKYRIIDTLLKSELKDGIVEVLIPYVANKEVTDIESAGTVNLEIRPDYQEGDELKEDSSDDEEEDEKKKKLNKKKIQKAKNKEEQENSKNGKQKGKEPKEEKVEIKMDPEEEKKDRVEKEMLQERKEAGKPGLKCLSCKHAVFANNGEFRTHFKSEWHNFNLKRKIEKLEALSEEEFKVHQLDVEFIKEKI